MSTEIDPRTFAPMEVARSQTFDGATSNEINQSGNFSESDFTLSGLVLVSAFDNTNETILSQADGLGTGRSYLLIDSSTGRWATSIGGGLASFASIPAVTTGSWNTFSLVHDASEDELTLTVGGASETKSVAMEIATGNFIVGAAKTKNSNTALNGILQDLRFNGLEQVGNEFLLQ